MSDEQNESQPSGREPTLSERTAAKTGSEPALSFDRLLPGLRDGLTAEDREARLRALQAAFDKPEKSIHLLRVLLDAEYDPRTRQRAAAALGQIGDVQSAPALLKIIDDPNPKVRRVAVWALGQIGSEDAYSSLIDRLEIETDSSIQLVLVDALIHCADLRLVPRLMQLRDTYPPDQKFCRRSSDLLTNIAEHRAYDQIIGFMENDDPEIQRWAAEFVAERCPPVGENIPLLLKCVELGAAAPAFLTLARVDDDRIWEIFSQYLYDNNEEICQAVLRALGRNGTDRATGMILEFLHTNDQDELETAAIDVLKSSSGLYRCLLSSELNAVLSSLLVDASQELQLRLVVCLAELRDDRAYALLRDTTLKSEHGNVRFRTLMKLPFHQQLEPSLLLELLSDDEMSIRRQVTWYLRSIIGNRLVSQDECEILVGEVRNHVIRESNIEARLIQILILLDEGRTAQLLEMACQALKQLPKPTFAHGSIYKLFGHLLSEDSPYQTQLLDLIRNHPVKGVRWEYIQVIRHWVDERIIALIIDLLHSDPDASNRSSCVSALSDYPPSPTIISALIEALNDSGSRWFPVCERAATALRNIGTPEALAAVEAWEQSRAQQ